VIFVRVCVLVVTMYHSAAFINDCY